MELKLNRKSKMFLCLILLIISIYILYCFFRTDHIYYDDYGLIPKNTFVENKKDDFNILNNRVYVVGDSRMYLFSGFPPDILNSQ